MQPNEMEEMFAIIRSGGWVMIGLGIIGFLLYSTGFSTMVFLWKGNLNNRSRQKWAKWIIDPKQGQGRTGEILRYVQDSPKVTAKKINRRFDEIRESILSNIDRRLILLKTLVGAAPLTGLLGTVMGMLTTFLGLATSARGETISSIAGGIKEALITTQTGLMVALPGVFITLLIQQKRGEVAATIAQLESLTLLHCVEEEDISNK